MKENKLTCVKPGRGRFHSHDLLLSPHDPVKAEDSNLH